jgi:hypothetical protein
MPVLIRRKKITSVKLYSNLSRSRMSSFDQYSHRHGALLSNNRRKETSMSYRTVISIAAAAILGVACVSTEALAYRAGGVYRGGAYRGGAYRGGYVGRGVGVGIGAAAVGAAVLAPRYYNRAACGYYPYPACY